MKSQGIDRVSGLLDGVAYVYVPSPNCDDRPPDTEPDTVVIHAISLPPGQYGGDRIDDLFLNQLDPSAHAYFRTVCNLRVSSHFLVRRDGEIAQFVPVSRRAWHAGVSEFEGRNFVNDFSVGIELEGTDDTPFESVQYDSLSLLTRLLISAYPGINMKRIVGHSDIAPGRKADPGPHFDWFRFLGSL